LDISLHSLAMDQQVVQATCRNDVADSAADWGYLHNPCRICIRQWLQRRFTATWRRHWQLIAAALTQRRAARSALRHVESTTIVGTPSTRGLQLRTLQLNPDQPVVRTAPNHQARRFLTFHFFGSTIFRYTCRARSYRGAHQMTQPHLRRKHLAHCVMNLQDHLLPGDRVFW
jgi:hypothetical protein